jgi:hypothetical protein
LLIEEKERRIGIDGEEQLGRRLSWMVDPQKEKKEKERRRHQIVSVEICGHARCGCRKIGPLCMPQATNTFVRRCRSIAASKQLEPPGHTFQLQGKVFYRRMKSVRSANKVEALL